MRLEECANLIGNSRVWREAGESAQSSAPGNFCALLMAALFAMLFLGGRPLVHNWISIDLIALGAVVVIF